MRNESKWISGLAVTLAVIGMVWMVPSARAADIPIKLYGKVTPSDVYRIGIAINKFAYNIVGKTTNKNTRRAILSLTQKKESGKKPSDVVQIVYSVHEQVNRLREKRGLKRIERYARQDGKVTPAVVFINAGIALDGLAEISMKIDSTKSYGNLYEAPPASGKTPSDAFSIMDLAYRILVARRAKPAGAALN